MWLASSKTLTRRLLSPAGQSCIRRLTTFSENRDAARPGPLEGIKVLELGQLIAGPFCGQLLAHFGAEVIKVEPPGVGDPLRVWRELDVDGVSPWFRSLARNKKSITLDLRKEKGREIAKKLTVQSDVVIENFKPGTLEKWGLGPEDLYPSNPGLVFTRISGYGQTGPMRSEPGFAAVCEGFGGLRFINGNVNENGKLDGAPIRPNISLGDSLAGLHGAFGTVMALLARNKVGNGTSTRGQRTGQTVDVAIYESILNMMEGIIPAYSRTGSIRGPSGAGVTGIVPTSAFPTSNSEEYVIIGGNGDSIYLRLMDKIGRNDLTGEKYKGNADRVAAQKEIEDAISDWTSKHTMEEVLQAMKEAKVPAGPIQSVSQMVDHPQIKARGMVEDVRYESADKKNTWDIQMPGISPILERGGQGTRWAGRDLGQDNHSVYSETLGMTSEEVEELRRDGVI
ncbi:unnamed protein product [Sympodiomycopsis kandeliae]